MANILIEQIINANCIKYDRLTQMVNQAFTGSNANKMNLYIDLYSLLKPMYNQNYNINDYSTVTSCIVNLCTHYRTFFRTRYKVEVDIYLVYSKNTSIINKQFYMGYNNKNESSFNTNKLIDEMIGYDINLLRILCPYLPDIHFVEGTFETGVLIYDVICRNECRGHQPHVILTKDMYNYQLVSMNDNILIFRPKKSEGKDISYYITQQNLIQQYLTDRDNKTSMKISMIPMPGLLSLIMTLSSVKERNIKMLCNITTAFKLIDKAISEFKIMNGYNSDPITIWNGLDNEKINISDKGFEFRFKSIDIQYQHSIFITTPESKSITFVNLDDPQAVIQINNQYFINNPLDVLGL